MTKIILSGCCGHMGNTVTNLAASTEDTEIVAGVDVKECYSLPYPVFASFSEITVKDADVIIDFSHPSTLSDILEYSLENSIPVILCATGYSEEQTALINSYSGKCAIFRSANMSIGINLISELCKTAAKILGNSFDIEIVESHHNLKLDAPSGTALMLERSVEEGLDYEPELVFDRHSKRAKRDKKEIGMHSVRGGNIVGEHEVIFAGQDEVIKISHSANSKSVFAAGALNAARFMKGKTAGLYDMSDVINE